MTEANVAQTGDVFGKCFEYTRADALRDHDVYVVFRNLDSAQTPEVMVDGRKMILIGSNNYLGLTVHPHVTAAAIEAISRYGTGCAGSRWLNGSTVLHAEMERRLASFFRREAAVVATTGYQGNMGLISCLISKDDIVILDKMDHASIIDGCRLSSGTLVRYRHNDMDELEYLLKQEAGRSKLIIVDGVFSMEGDIVDLPPLVELAKRYKARVIVDDAHGAGVLGKEGRGTVEHFGLEDEVDLIIGTLSKAFGAIGGYAVGDDRVIDWIKHSSRPHMFSCALPPSVPATVIAALDIIETEPELRKRLWDNRQTMKEGLDRLGFDTGQSGTPIIPVILKKEPLMLSMVIALADRGVFCNPVSTPAVPEGHALIRVSVSALHTQDQIGQVLSAFEGAGRSTGVIQ